MMPAHQRFEAGDVAIDARLRLIVQRKLVARDGRAQLLLQGPLLAQLLIHRYFEKADGPTHLRFRAEQRRIRVRNEGRSVDTILRIDTDANRESHMQDVAVDFDVAIKRRSQPFCEGLGRGRLGPGRRDDGKFVATEPRKKAPWQAVSRRRATSRSKASPMAWPNTSLTDWKRSRSMQSNAKLSFETDASPIVEMMHSLNAARLGRSVSAS